MKKTTLQDWVKKTSTTQQQLANALGISQAGVSKMLRSDRSIFVEKSGKRWLISENRIVGNIPA